MLNQIDLLSTLPGLAPGEKPRLLVVDDQPVNIQVLYKVFASDCQVLMATSGHQALKVARDNLPDLILLDVQMPDIDGYEVCRQLKDSEMTRHIPVIFVTAENDAEQETHGLGVGAVDFISKPINPAVLRARVRTHLLLKYQSDILRNMVFLDGLTGVFNRRYFDQQLAIEWARAGRGGRPLSLLMIDVDYFKRFNDEYGHQRGDDCLRQVAGVLRGTLKRTTDLVARYGGEEFVGLLPDTQFDQALMLARKVEEEVRNAQIPHEKSDAAPVVTISIGVSTRHYRGSAGSTTDLLSLADSELYRAKMRGRACVLGASLAPPAAAP